MRIARDSDLLLRVEYRPGDYVVEDTILVLAKPADRVDDQVERGIRRSFASGSERTPQQDLMFLVNELVEIAARALSPGINDPFTAMNCLDWLGAALIRIGQRELPDALRYDDEQRLRIISFPTTFEAFVDAVFDRLRPYFRDDRIASLHMMKVIGEVGLAVPLESQRRRLIDHAGRLREGCAQALGQSVDVDKVDECYRALIDVLQSPTPMRRGVRERWFAGTG